MNLLSGIESRTSALKLTTPGPTSDQLAQILHAGTRAPDHGRLRPWRFVVLEGDARLKLGDAMAHVLRTKLPTADAAQLDGERNKVLRAPTIIVVAAHITRGKIPEIEQVLAVGATTQNMMLAAHALGVGAMWKTGGAVYDANVKTALGLASEDHIVALLYLGTIATAGPVVPTTLDGVVTYLEAG